MAVDLTFEELKPFERRYGSDAVQDALLAYFEHRLGGGKRWHTGRFVLEIKSRARNARRSEEARKAREERWARHYYQ